METTNSSNASLEITDDIACNKLDKHLSAYQGNSLYDFDNEILLTWYPQRVIQHAGAARSLLELGLGHGHSTPIFAQHFTRHVILEGSSAVIQNFRNNHPACPSEIVHTYFETFSTDERFDVILMGFILEHVENPSLILRRYRPFLSPNGKIFLAVPNAEALNRRLGHIAGLLEDMRTLSENDLRLGHQRYYTVDHLKTEIAEAGYQLDRLEGIYLKPFATQQIQSLQLSRPIIDAMCTVGLAYPELSCGILAEISAQ